jgi:hypothetical protein
MTADLAWQSEFLMIFINYRDWIFRWKENIHTIRFVLIADESAVVIKAIAYKSICGSKGTAILVEQPKGRLNTEKYRRKFNR